MNVHLKSKSLEEVEVKDILADLNAIISNVQSIAPKQKTLGDKSSAIRALNKLKNKLMDMVSE